MVSLTIKFLAQISQELMLMRCICKLHRSISLQCGKVPSASKYATGGLLSVRASCFEEGVPLKGVGAWGELPMARNSHSLILSCLLARLLETSAHLSLQTAVSRRNLRETRKLVDLALLEGLNQCFGWLSLIWNRIMHNYLVLFLAFALLLQFYLDETFVAYILISWKIYPLLLPTFLKSLI